MPPTPLAPTTRSTWLESLRAGDMMTPNPISVRHGVSVRDAALFLDKRGVGAAPVVNDAGRAVGVLSRSDVLLAVNAGVDTAPVREVMTPSVIAVSPDATALEVTEVMVQHMVRRVFVVDGAGVPVGVVSTTDLFRGLRTLWGRTGPVGRRLPTASSHAPEEYAPMLEPPRPPPRRSARELMTVCPVLLPQTMGVRSAAVLLDAAGLDAAPVVDSGGRCVGVFTVSDYLRWLAGNRGSAPAGRPDAVGNHMTRRVAVAALDADADELCHRMRGGAGPFAVVIDRQRRPRGIVCGLDLLANDTAATREGVP